MPKLLTGNLFGSNSSATGIAKTFLFVRPINPAMECCYRRR